MINRYNNYIRTYTFSVDYRTPAQRAADEARIISRNNRVQAGMSADADRTNERRYREQSGQSAEERYNNPLSALGLNETPREISERLGDRARTAWRATGRVTDKAADLGRTASRAIGRRVDKIGQGIGDWFENRARNKAAMAGRPSTGGGLTIMGRKIFSDTDIDTRTYGLKNKWRDLSPLKKLAMLTAGAGLASYGLYQSGRTAAGMEDSPKKSTNSNLLKKYGDTLPEEVKKSLEREELARSIRENK